MKTVKELTEKVIATGKQASGLVMITEAPAHVERTRFDHVKKAWVECGRVKCTVYPRNGAPAVQFAMVGVV